MANTLLKHTGRKVGNSICENNCEDLIKEIGFQDKFFEKQLNYLMGYEEKTDNEVSENSLLDFHLSHRTNPDFYLNQK